MSDGLCHNQCPDNAFAVVQGSNCWCSDYEPDSSVQTDVSDCNTSCPGFPSDTCGGDGLWGYMAMGKEPSGTKGAGSSTGSTTTKVSNRSLALDFFISFFQARGLVKSPWAYPCPMVWFGSKVLATTSRRYGILT